MSEEPERREQPRGGPQSADTPDKRKQRRLAYVIAAIGAVGVVIAWLTYRKSGGQQAAAQAGQGSTPRASGYTYPMVSGGGSLPYGSQDPSQAGYDQALLQAITALPGQISGAGSTSTDPSRSGPYSGGIWQGSGPNGSVPASGQPTSGQSIAEQLMGSGYLSTLGGASTPISTNSGTFQWFSTPAQASAYGAGGGQSYYEPLPGFFQPVSSWGALAPGTPIYGKTS